MLATISPDMDMDTAAAGLANIMEAYGIRVNDVLDGIMDKINTIGNDSAISNSNIVSMLQDSASAMADANNTLEETIALETAAYKILQDNNVGNGFKTAALRLQGLNEETGMLDRSLQTIKQDFYSLTGISIMEDADTYKSTYQILKEISSIWNSLTDTSRSNVLELMFGSKNMSIGASILNNFQAVEDAMNKMANSAGSVETGMSAATDSIQYKLNRLSETGVGIAQNLFQGNDIKLVINGITSIAEAVDSLTSKLGLLWTIAVGGGLYAGIKNIGKRIRAYAFKNKMIVEYCFEYALHA